MMAAGFDGLQGAINTLPDKAKIVKNADELPGSCRYKLQDGSLTISAAAFAAASLEYGKQQEHYEGKGKTLDVSLQSLTDSATRTTLKQFMDSIREGKGLPHLSAAAFNKASRAEVLTAISELSKSMTPQDYKTEMEALANIMGARAIESRDPTLFCRLGDLMDRYPSLSTNSVEFWKHADAMWTYLSKTATQVFLLMSERADPENIPSIFAYPLCGTLRDNTVAYVVLNLFTQHQSVLKADLLKLADKVANKHRKPKPQQGSSREDTAKSDDQTVIREWFASCSAHIRNIKAVMENARRFAQAVGTPGQTGRAKGDPHAKTDSLNVKTPAHQVKKSLAAPMLGD
jgi:hypothetical protein